MDKQAGSLVEILRNTDRRQDSEMWFLPTVVSNETRRFERRKRNLSKSMTFTGTLVFPLLLGTIGRIQWKLKHSEKFIKNL